MKMMAKKPCDRYPSMNDVAQALQQWLADHGSPSASGGPGLSGSSGLAGSSRLGRTPRVAQRLTQAGPPSKRGSGELPRAVAESPATGLELTDTVADFDRSATPPPSIVRRKSDSNGLTDPKLRERLLPKATPLDASLPSSGTNGEPPVSLEDVLGSDASGRARPHGNRASSRQFLGGN